MASNTFGTTVTLTTAGESHGPYITAILDGIPAGIPIETGKIQKIVDDYNAESKFITPRKEPNHVVITGGCTVNNDGYLLSNGGPISFMIENVNQKPVEYANLSTRMRHVDTTYPDKYRLPLQSGSGRASARTLITHIVAGEICRKFLNKNYVIPEIRCKLIQVGRTQDKEWFYSVLQAAQNNGDSLGAIVKVTIEDLPKGLGEPFAHKFHAEIGRAMLSINGVKGFEFGDGFDTVNYSGKELDERIQYNNGVHGGITTGEKFIFNVVFQPTPTYGQGRHDICIALRGMSIIKSYCWLVIADLYKMSLS